MKVVWAQNFTRKILKKSVLVLWNSDITAAIRKKVMIYYFRPNILTFLSDVGIRFLGRVFGKRYLFSNWSMGFGFSTKIFGSFHIFCSYKPLFTFSPMRKMCNYFRMMKDDTDVNANIPVKWTIGRISCENSSVLKDRKTFFTEIECQIL